MVEINRTIKAAELAAENVVIVSGEVAGGIASTDPNARRYQELVSRANRRLMESANKVFKMTAGKQAQLK